MYHQTSISKSLFRQTYHSTIINMKLSATSSATAAKLNTKLFTYLLTYCTVTHRYYLLLSTAQLLSLWSNWRQRNRVDGLSAAVGTGRVMRRHLQHTIITQPPPPHHNSPTELYRHQLSTHTHVGNLSLKLHASKLVKCLLTLKQPADRNITKVKLMKKWNLWTWQKLMASHWHIWPLPFGTIFCDFLWSLTSLCPK